MEKLRPLRVLLCHASQDKPRVRQLYQDLKSESWIDPWLDEEKLLPGQDWDLEIYKGLREADVIFICLSKESITKEGYVQKEFKRAVNFAEEKPEGTIYIIPLRLDNCDAPVKFRKWQWSDYFVSGAYDKLVLSLTSRAKQIGLNVPTASPVNNVPFDKRADFYQLIKIPPTLDVRYPFRIGKYPVTNRQYERFLNSPDFTNEIYWSGCIKFNNECRQVGQWGNEGLNWLHDSLNNPQISPDGKHVLPAYWNSKDFGHINPENPVNGVSWYEACAYCNWLRYHWNELEEEYVNSGLSLRLIRLPLEIEWVVAAGGIYPKGRYPWDSPGRATTNTNEVMRRSNIGHKLNRTSPVNAFPNGASPYGVMDMIGNVWEWQANLSHTDKDWLALRGDSWDGDPGFGSVSAEEYDPPFVRKLKFGFRIVVLSDDWRR